MTETGTKDTAAATGPASSAGPTERSNGDTAPARMTTDEARRHGYDAGRNGPNTVNCHFRIFSAPEFTRAWEIGNAAGRAAVEGCESGMEGPSARPQRKATAGKSPRAQRKTNPLSSPGNETEEQQR